MDEQNNGTMPAGDNTEEKTEEGTQAAPEMPATDTPAGDTTPETPASE